MTAGPVNKPGSAEVHFTDLAINGNTDGVGGDLLIVLGRSEGFAPLIADALTQNFTYDLTELQGKIRTEDEDRKRGGSGKRVSVRVDVGGSRSLKQKHKQK